MKRQSLPKHTPTVTGDEFTWLHDLTGKGARPARHPLGRRMHSTLPVLQAPLTRA
ncbi:MAG TPA: hypothetical protein VKB08_03690 [Bradyrhizobium sp.]|nr:hypothetical protein [Bradyrhizobium sp.]